MAPEQFSPHSRLGLTALAVAAVVAGAPAFADETSCSPFAPFNKGHEDQVYVIDFYDRGGIDKLQKDPLLKPVDLAPNEERSLAVFLRFLTGDSVAQLAADAGAVAPGDAPPAQVRPAAKRPC